MVSQASVDAARKLIALYRSITYDQIERIEYRDSADAANILTGFGDSRTCSLCDAVHSADPTSPLCEECIHSLTFVGDVYAHASPCMSGLSKISYRAIQDATNIEDLLDAFAARADYMESLVNEYCNTPTGTGKAAHVTEKEMCR